MAYYPDLSSYTYYSEETNPPTLNVGWLDKRYAYPQGETSEEFAERLWQFCRWHVVGMRGFHNCEFCPELANDVALHWRGGERLLLGSAEIRVFGLNGVAYAAPNMVYHYVVTHRYCPPVEFIQAVLEGPLPDSPEYAARAMGCTWWEDAQRWWQLQEEISRQNLETPISGSLDRHVLKTIRQLYT